MVIGSKRDEPERSPGVAEAAPEQKRVLPAQVRSAQRSECLAGGRGGEQPSECAAALCWRDAAGEYRVDCGQTLIRKKK